MHRRGPAPARARRRLLAFAVCPLGAGVAAILLGGVEHLLEHGFDPAPWTAWRWYVRQLLGSGLGVAVFAAPVAWLIAPFAVAWLLGCGFRSWLAFGATGGALGASVFVALHFFRIMDDPGVRLAPLGSACGFTAALLYWCIDVRPGRPLQRET